MRKFLLFVPLAAALLRGSETVKINAGPGTASQIFSAIGTFLNIGRTNAGSLYDRTHQCNWPLIGRIILNCPGRSASEVNLVPVKLEPAPADDNENKAARLAVSEMENANPVETELVAVDELAAKAALEQITDQAWNRDTVARMSSQQRSDLSKRCFEDEPSFLLCTIMAWKHVGMDMCQVWNHAFNYEEFCGEANACDCMSRPCFQARFQQYNQAVGETFRIDPTSRLPVPEWKPAHVDLVQKDWCDQN
ncbi:hypothetical protein BGX28_003617 [Mortierella sp. GBA30]|nr:hypothetical protein BGX28_003617 [Mortierella sp. GBA30]